MMTLDQLNNLNLWPLKNIDEFIEHCTNRRIREINVTGSNTDPLLYLHTKKLRDRLQKSIPNLVMGIRTNGVLVEAKPEVWNQYDKASISICSLNPGVYQKMMGSPIIPNLERILALSPEKPIKVNIILGPENAKTDDLTKTLDKLADLGIKKVNLREPYGQPHVGNPLAHLVPSKSLFGMPIYHRKGSEVMYWDVHYVEVESINLYANGRVSETYPITKGHSETGKVLSQDNFPKSGRQQEQWLSYKK